MSSQPNTENKRKLLFSFIVIGGCGWVLAAWLFFAGDMERGSMDTMDTMEEIYRSGGETHKAYEDMLYAEEGRFPSVHEYDKEVRALTLDAHASALGLTEEFEIEMMRLNPADEPLISLIKGRQAERTAVALVGIRDFFDSPAIAGIEVVTTTPDTGVAASPTRDDPPTFILAKGVVFPCPYLTDWFDEADPRPAYPYLAEKMTSYWDEAGRYADFESADARAALAECGR